VHRTRGDYGAALESYFNSLSIFEQIKAPLGTTLGSIGLVRALQGDYPRALEYYSKALEEFKNNSNRVETARVLALIGNVYYGQGQYESALSSYRQALALREAMDDKSGQGDILAGIGSTHLRLKNYSEGLDSFEKALGLFKSVSNQEKMADVLTRVSQAFLLQNDFAKALSAAESAVTIATQVGNNELLWYARMLTGKAHAKLEHGPQAYNAFTGAIATVESLREEASVASVGDHSRSLPYLSVVDFLMSEHRPSEAFHYAERAKTQFLIDLLKDNNAVPQKGLSLAQRREEQRLAGEVASLEIQVERDAEQRSQSEARRSELQDKLRRSRAAYVEFRRKAFSANPALKIGRGELAPLKLDEIRLLINDTSTALLEYAITETNTYLFVLTADKTGVRRQMEINLKVYTLEVRHDELASRVRHFQQLLASRADNFHELAQELYDLLVKPAEDQIGLKTKLVVVPDGSLWHLPFEALQPSEDHYVVDQAQVSYAPSLSSLREMRKQRLPIGRLNSLFIAYANPELSKNFKTRFELAYAGVKLESSAEQEEIKRVATSYYAGPQASEEQVKSDILRARIVHFSSPAILDDTSPMSSFIGLSSATSQQDGFLQIREIMDLQSTAKLVVASTAQPSAVLNGNAAVSFSWAWFVAGTPATLVSRWKVESPIPLSEFYSTMKQTGRTRVSKSRALHQNLLAIRRSPDHQHPYYWANLAMIGDAR
jgi:CHAT domain-containing protein